MPRATAMWLINHTALTFEQIGDFCGLHILEVQSIADEEPGTHITEEDPIANGQLLQSEIAKCEQDPNTKLSPNTAFFAISHSQTSKRSKKYTPIARRQDKPDAILWLLKNYPELTDKQIVKLIGTTNNMIESIRNKEHWNMQNIRPRDPVLLGLCLQSALNALVEEINKRKPVVTKKPSDMDVSALEDIEHFNNPNYSDTPKTDEDSKSEVEFNDGSDAHDQEND
jgi:hypothetical protein